MRHFLFASHGYFADGIKHALEMIIGKRANVSTICAYTTNDVDIKDQIKEAVEKTAPDELIVVTDLFGGSVNNEFMNLLADNPRIYLVAGLNLPLVVELVSTSDAEPDTTAFISKALASAKESMQFCNLSLHKTTADDDF